MLPQSNANFTGPYTAQFWSLMHTGWVIVCAEALRVHLRISGHPRGSTREEPHSGGIADRYEFRSPAFEKRRNSHLTATLFTAPNGLNKDLP